MIKKCKKNNNRNYNSNYENKNIRMKIITQNIKSICNYLDFSNETFYKTISLIDSVSSKYLFNDNMFKKVSLVCLGLASKVHESQDKALYTNSLQLILKNPKEDYAKLEKTILTALDFDLNIVTPFECVMIFFKLENIYQGINCNLRKNYRKFVFKLANYVSLEYEMNKYNTLAVALCVIMVSRKIFDCDYLLPSEIQRHTRYSKEMLNTCYNDVIIIGQRLLNKLSKVNTSFSSDQTKDTISQNSHMEFD
jgi:hypothetical protein